MHDGAVVRMDGTPPEAHGEFVSFSTVFTSRAWEAPEVSHSTLRFLDAMSLAGFLDEANLVIEEQFGEWDRQPLTAASPEIITIARRT